MSNTRQHRQWIREDHSEDTREQDRLAMAWDIQAFLGLEVKTPTGSILITEANIGQLFNC